MKNKKKIFITIMIIILIAIIILFVTKNNKAEEKYTGYQLELVSKYGGYGVGGQDLGTQIKKKIYNIKQGDKFYEQINGGIWILNYSNTDGIFEKEKEPELTIGIYEKKIEPKLTIEIAELDENTVTIKEANQTMETILHNKNNKEPHSIGYNEEYEIDSRFSPNIDGPNYSYTIKIIKKN